MKFRPIDHLNKIIEEIIADRFNAANDIAQHMTLEIQIEIPMERLEKR